MRKTDFFAISFKTTPNLSIFASRRLHFLESGLLIINPEEKFQFAAPIMRIFLVKSLFKARVDIQLSPSTTFDEFLLRSIERMSPSILRNSLRRGSFQLHERSLQMEWYRTSLTVVPVGAIVCPDVGKIFGSIGFLDFYISSKQHSWAQRG
ncbi:hypothetical protein BC936DRAFT_137507 [Jimgerdemannia flammicorona]|uniref:Uncharacterized protein n=1 Tax=Jimgerdemannia flammicorona TaxID=994334 RepID=A0A433CX79_9FUNG|nr:hypothetical protein BC936DRAFT_137507 [Jimgerdemannia flammicorona]